MDAGDPGATSFSFSCAQCRAVLTATADSSGRRGRCRHCGAIQFIPEATGGYALSASTPPPAPGPASPPVERARRPRLGSSVWKDATAWLHASTRDPSALEGEAVALIVLSLADLMVTYHLLRSGPGFYESNPIARFFFSRWNIAGMAVFKFSMVGFVVVVGEVVERSRPGLGRFVVLIGCAASAAVVCYGLKLALGGTAG